MDGLLNLNDTIIEKITAQVRKPIEQLLGDNLVNIILFGSCARGDFKEESDVDIAIITKTDREDNRSLRMELSDIATEMAVKYMAVVNFLCVPEHEYEERKSWYTLYKNISDEGIEI